VSALLLAARVLAARLLVVVMMTAAAACTNTGTVEWHVVQTTDAPSSSPTPCPYGPLADAPGCQPAPPPTPTPTGPDGKDYVPWCLPTDPPGSYCEQP
jgi:hypothetical protein